MLKKLVYCAFLATALFGLVNCAKDGGGGGSKKVATTPACSSGQVETSYGCLPTSQCSHMGSNYGYHSTYGCVPAGTTSSVDCRGSCQSGYVQTIYGCMKKATKSQCGTQYTCAGYGVVNGIGAAQCVPGIDTATYYGNQYYQYFNGYNPYQYYYQPYYYSYPYYGNGGLYFYFGW